MAEADHQAALSIVRSADRIETFRVRSRLTLDDTRRRKDPKFADKYLDHLWPIEKRGLVLSKDFARKLEAFLLDKSNFVGMTPGGDKACIFSPGVVFQFRNGSDFVGIVICFDCAQLATYSSKGNLNIPSIDFDPGYSRLSALAKEAFPNDDVIRALR